MQFPRIKRPHSNEAVDIREMIRQQTGEIPPATASVTSTGIQYGDVQSGGTTSSDVESLRKEDGGTERTGRLVLIAVAPIELTETTEASGDAGFSFGYTGPYPKTIDESCADDATTDIVLGAVADISAVTITYHCLRGARYEWGTITVGLMGAATAGVLRRSDSDNCGLVIAADVNAGNLRLNITTDDSGDASDFRGTYLEVAI